LATDDWLAGRSILVVEDEYLLADEMRVDLERAGATVLGPFSTLKEAHALVERSTLDCAVLDLNLHGELSFGLGRKLAADGIPYVFVTGYEGASFPEEFARVPRFSKPVDRDALVRCLIRLAGKP
jgi:CheY-like chemotaxis protein